MDIRWYEWINWLIVILFHHISSYYHHISSQSRRDMDWNGGEKNHFKPCAATARRWRLRLCGDDRKGKTIFKAELSGNFVPWLSGCLLDRGSCYSYDTFKVRNTPRWIAKILFHMFNIFNMFIWFGWFFLNFYEVPTSSRIHAGIHTARGASHLAAFGHQCVLPSRGWCSGEAGIGEFHPRALRLPVGKTLPVASLVRALGSLAAGHRNIL